MHSSSPLTSTRFIFPSTVPSRFVLLRATPRAVQRSLHGPQREHCIDSSDSDAIAPVTHVVHVVEAEDIGGEGSQASEDAGIAADPTVVLAEADIADIVQSVLDPPMAAGGVSAGCGGQGDGGNERV